MVDIIQKFGVIQYYHQSGCIRRLPEYLERLGSTKTLVLHGENSWKAAKNYWPENLVSVDYLLFSGECSFEEVERVAHYLQEGEYEAIIGLGGGKVLDTVKAAVSIHEVKSILIPTLPSNCACLTPHSIMYSDKGIHLKTIRFNHATNLVLVEPQLLVEAPVFHFASGIGDTLAKWYENRVSFNLIEDQKKTIPVELGKEIAKKCADTVLNYGKQALKSVKKDRSSHEFSKVLDAIYYLAALVGGTSAKYGQSVAAHAFFYAHTDYFIQSYRKNDYSHGAVVAYGILIQLSLQNNITELKELIPYYSELGLPIRLNDIGLHSDEAELLELSKKVVKSGSYIFKINKDLKADDIVEAIKKLEQIVVEERDFIDDQIIRQSSLPYS